MTVIAPKACTGCGVVSTDFTRHTGRYDGLQSRCRKCNRLSQARRRLRPEARAKDLESRRAWLLNPANIAKRAAERKRVSMTPEGWAQRTLRVIRYRARKRGIAFDLTLADLALPAFCPVLGIPILLGGGGCGPLSPHSPSVDRLDNVKGYTRENIRIISNRANLLKKDATTAEIRAILAYMEEGGVP